MLTNEERNELDKQYALAFPLLWLIAKWKCGGSEEAGRDLLQESMLLACSKKKPWCNWTLAVVAGITFVRFMRGIMARTMSNIIKRRKNDPQIHFRGDMTADDYGSTGHYDSPEQVATDKDLFYRTRDKLAEKGQDDAVKCMDLFKQGVPEPDLQAEILKWDVKRVYKAHERMKAAVLAIKEEGDES